MLAHPSCESLWSGCKRGYLKEGGREEGREGKKRGRRKGSRKEERMEEHEGGKDIGYNATIM